MHWKEAKGKRGVLGPASTPTSLPLPRPSSGSSWVFLSGGRDHLGRPLAQPCLRMIGGGRAAQRARGPAAAQALRWTYDK